MRLGEVRSADDDDFERLRNLCERHDDWRLDYNKSGTMVWTKANDVSDFRMVKVSPPGITVFPLDQRLDLAAENNHK